MSTLLRWAVYRSTMLGPSYLGDVLARDREAAIRAGEVKYLGTVVVHRAVKPGAVSPALEAALRGVTKRDSRRPRGAFRRGGAR